MTVDNLKLLCAEWIPMDCIMKVNESLHVTSPFPADFMHMILEKISFSFKRGNFIYTFRICAFLCWMDCRDLCGIFSCLFTRSPEHACSSFLNCVSLFDLIISDINFQIFLKSLSISNIATYSCISLIFKEFSSSSYLFITNSKLFANISILMWNLLY